MSDFKKETNCPICKCKLPVNFYLPDDYIFEVKEDIDNGDVQPFSCRVITHGEALQAWFYKFEGTFLGTKRLLVRRKEEDVWLIVTINDEGMEVQNERL